MRRLLDLAVETVPRMLGLCDRETSSATAGCCDRNYWHYRLLDVANARFQEAGLLFALAYATPDPANPFAGKLRLAEWSRLAWRFWLKRRNADGSVSEVYPNERSFCATAFTGAAFVETVRLLGGREAWGEELAAARSTMVWLDANANSDIANQMAASLLALAGYARLTGDVMVAEMAARRRRIVLDAQWPDGTLAEYGGLDAGYQTITLSTLASILALDRADADLARAIERGVAAIRPHISEDGTMDRASNSRSTQYIYPHALAVVRSDLLDRVLTGIDTRTVLRPTWMDDRYCHALAVDYLLAYREIAHVDDHVSPDRA